MTRDQFATRPRDREASDRNVRPAGTGKPRLNLAIEATLRGRERLCFSLDGPVGGAVDRARLPPARTYLRINRFPVRRSIDLRSRGGERNNQKKKNEIRKKKKNK